MSIRLLTIQSAKSKWLEIASDEYAEKINFFHKFELVNLKSSKRGREDAASKKKDETEILLKNLKEDDYVIVFDERGTSLNSMQFSEMIRQLQLSGTKRINFIIGGAFGIDESLQKRAQKKIRVSDLILNHHVALVVALEQIYRAYAIIHNKPYHNE